RQAPTQAAGFLADLDCTIMDVSCRDSELSEIPCGEPRKTVFSRSNRDLFPFVVRYRTMNGAGNLQTALRYLRAMVRYLTMRGDSIHGIAMRGNRFFEVPYSWCMASWTSRLLMDTAAHTPRPRAMGRKPVLAICRRSDDRPMAARATMIMNSASRCRSACQLTGIQPAVRTAEATTNHRMNHGNTRRSWKRPPSLRLCRHASISARPRHTGMISVARVSLTMVA